jgi:hypothetical protein
VKRKIETFKTPSTKAKEEALHHPNGYVYVIDETYLNKEDVPPYAIRGAWKVNNKGIIDGDFIPNENYRKG